MKYEHIQIKSDKKQICEDYFSIGNDSIFAVLDGATPTSTFKDNKGRNGATLASTIVGEAVKMFANENVDIKTCISKANSLLLDEMNKNGIKLENKHETWNTYLAMVRIGEDYIDFGQIGDCMIFVVTISGEVEVLSKDMVVGIRDRAKQERMKMREIGFPIQSEDFYSIEKNSLEFNRYLANKDNGYAVLNGDKNADKYLITGRIEKKNYSQVLLISDGLFPKNRDWNKMIDNIKEKGLEKYALDLVEHEMKHQLYQDDKTGIFIDLS